MPVTVSSSLLSKLRKVNPSPAAPKEEDQEKCSFCGQAIPSDHRHLLEISSKRFVCACEVCAIIQAVHAGYKILPQRYFYLKNFNMSDELWSEFMIPVNMAFFVFSSKENGIVAYYPAAAGATESKLKMEAWQKLQELNPLLQNLTPDVEALLINRLDNTGEYFFVPIDSCYRLIGIIRSNWKGIFGGKGVQDAAQQFFIELKNKTADA